MADPAKPILDNGKIKSDRITDKINSKIEKGKLSKVRAIIVHQTGSKTAESSFSSYKDGKNGAHFLLDTDGTIYQTARVNQKCWHVGEIKSRCYQLEACSADELKNIKKILFKQKQSYQMRVKNLYLHEEKKDYPDRYPTNEDSIGIELVSGFSADKGYEPATKEQNDSLAWLVSTLEDLLSLTAADIYRHSEVGYKQPTEASTASW